MNSPNTMLFRRGATRLIALHGGWNDRSRRAVLWLAARHSIPATEIASVLASQEIVEHAPLASSEAVSTARSMAMRGSVVPQDRNTQVLAVMFIVSVVSLVLSIGIALIVLPSALRGQRSTPDTRTAPSTSPVTESEPRREVRAGPGITSAPVEVDVLAGLGRDQPIASVLAELEPAFHHVSAQWRTATRSDRREQRAVISAALMRLFSDADSASQAFEVLDRLFDPLIAEPLDDEQGITGEQASVAILAADVLDSLDARRLSAWVGQRLRTLLGALGADRSSPDVVGGAVRASAIALRTPRDAPGNTERIKRAGEAWSEWLGAVGAAAGADTARRSAFLLTGMDVLTKQSPDATDSIAVTSALRTLSAALSWEPGSPERVWLARAMLDAEISSESLYIITGAMVTSSAPGIDATMVVARNAGESARRDAMDRFMAVWGMTSSVEMIGFTSRWTQITHEVLSSSDSDAAAQPRAALDRAVLMATLNAAAAQATDGEFERADELLTVARSASQRTTPTDTQPLERFSPATDESSGRWGMEFLSYETDSAGRLGVLRRVPRQLDEVDAEVLVTAALRDPASQVRRAAASSVRTLSDEPAIVNALLEAAPFMPRSASTSSLVADVTVTPQVTTGDPRWRAKIRLVLVERLHELIGLRSQGPWIDLASQELAKLYAQQAGVPAEASSDDPLVEIAALYAVWLDHAQAELGSGANSSGEAGLEGVRSRLSRRLAIARSDPQRLVAYRRAITEMMASVIAAQRPNRAERIAELVALAGVQLDETGHVFGQIETLEQLALELWLVRLEDQQ